MKARFTPEAADRIRKLHPDIKRRVREGVRHLTQNSLDGHALQLDLAGLRSYRLGNYRIVYRIDEERHSLDILLVARRRDVYENLRELLATRRRK